MESVETGKMPTAEEKEEEEGDGEDSDNLQGIKCQAPIEEVDIKNKSVLCVLMQLWWYLYSPGVR